MTAPLSSASQSTSRELKALSKLLSLVLRHQPDTLGLHLDPEGWVTTADLLVALQAHGHPVDLTLLQQIVAENDKRRFEFNDDGSRLRASQGHSVSVDLGYVPSHPPALLYHGTIKEHCPAIRQEGLKKGSRQHVHLSADLATATKVGGRRGKPVILTVRAGDLHAAGHAFYVSTNGVWLTDNVPPSHLEFPATSSPCTFS